LLGLQSPLDLFGHGLWQAQLLQGLFQGLQMVLGPCLCTPEPLARLLAATLLGLLRSFLLGTLDSLLVCLGLGHGKLLPLVASPCASAGGDHDPFFMWFQALSWPFARWPCSMAASGNGRKSQAHCISAKIATARSPRTTTRRMLLTDFSISAAACLAKDLASAPAWTRKVSSRFLVTRLRLG
jgi:hypothetical protein